MTEAKALLGMAKVLGAKEEMSAARNLAVWGCRGLQGAAGGCRGLQGGPVS
jgi:hypothetical protein